MIDQNETILEVENVRKWFPINRGIIGTISRQPQKYVKALDDVSFNIYKGETLGLVGESGCGKSTLAKTLSFLYTPDKGKISFENEEIRYNNKKSIHDMRMKSQMVFQDPYTSLNPRLSIRQVLYEILNVHNLCTSNERENKCISTLEMVGMNESAMDRYPNQFSGGQRQRISIARALIMDPTFLIADEPVSALDVSIQAQILNLLIDLKSSLNLTMLFISHDLRVVRYISDRVIVMYLGKIMESAPSEEIFTKPFHPYTDLLMKAAPVIDKEKKVRQYTIKGETPSPIDLPSGCRFQNRCPFVTDKCRQEEPGLRNVNGDRYVACHYPLTDNKA